MFSFRTLNEIIFMGSESKPLMPGKAFTNPLHIHGVETFSASGRWTHLQMSCAHFLKIKTVVCSVMKPFEAKF